MKYFYATLLTGLLLTACTSSNLLTYSFKATDAVPKKYSNIGIVAVLKSDGARANVEDAVAGRLRAKGYHITTTWQIWPFANNAKLMKEYGIEGEKLKEMIQQRVTSQKMDGLLIITLFDATKETQYVPGNTVSVGIAVSPGMYPVYGYPYYAYYGYAFNTISDPGYYVETSTYFTESNFYDIATEKLVWTGQMKTKMESSLETESQMFGQVLANAMVDAGIFLK